jgi:hypothetical protein
MAAIRRGTYLERVVYDITLLAVGDWWYQTGVGDSGPGYYRWDGATWAYNITDALLPIEQVLTLANLIQATNQSAIFAHASFSAGQNIPHNATTPIVFDAVWRDTDNVTPTAQADGIFRFNTAGMYIAFARAAWGANAAGDRRFRMVSSVDGPMVTQPHDWRRASANGATVQTLPGLYVFSGGDTLYLDAYQDSGGDLAFGDCYLTATLINRL